MKLSKLLLETEGFSMEGSFNDFQGDTQLIALRHHPSMSRPLLFCSLPMSGGGPFEEFLIRLTPKNSFKTDATRNHNKHHEHFEEDMPDLHFHLDLDHEQPFSTDKSKKDAHNHNHHNHNHYSLSLLHHKHKHHHHHHHNHHRLDFVGLKKGVSPWSKEGQDWGDIATVFGTHTKPSFYKAAIIRDPVTRLLAVLLTYCHAKHDVSGLSWERCNPPAVHAESATTTGVTALSIQRSMNSMNNNSTDKSVVDDVFTSLEEFIERLEAAAKPFLDPLLRSQIDQCGFRFSRYDTIGRFERLVSDSLKLAKLSGISHLLDQLSPIKSGESMKEWKEKMIHHEHHHGTVVSDEVCTHYNQNLLDRTYALYREDFDYFGYNTSLWSQKCDPIWNGGGKHTTHHEENKHKASKRKKGW
eukprot:CAMPEP_0114344618 /NCGR_PEP_ID=MMETSP0101-20121206/11565_1 /TAXON_ID=38822 ORGANISM="Pteridomonas danica, Strain PT" /NCGR_SAMPLE_ID=MMETSP0101 /ASSEMBLY_ACC=CAM_ASM_000211 /LENGTH=411 /DNA_ID=CAMNT_0001480077 /DNA_START=181 /DNA_END=1413 /DNA_ORIENTATION=-